MAFERLTLSSSSIILAYCSFFEKVPQAKILFGFPKDMNPGSEEMQTNKRFLAHASYMIRMFDKQLQMLGPDTELLEEILTDRKSSSLKVSCNIKVRPYFSVCLTSNIVY